MTEDDLHEKLGHLRLFSKEVFMILEKLFCISSKMSRGHKTRVYCILEKNAELIQMLPQEQQHLVKDQVKARFSFLRVKSRVL